MNDEETHWAEDVAAEIDGIKEELASAVAKVLEGHERLIPVLVLAVRHPDRPELVASSFYTEHGDQNVGPILMECAVRCLSDAAREAMSARFFPSAESVN